MGLKSNDASVCNRLTKSAINHFTFNLKRLFDHVQLLSCVQLCVASVVEPCVRLVKRVTAHKWCHRCGCSALGNGVTCVGDVHPLSFSLAVMSVFCEPGSHGGVLLGTFWPLSTSGTQVVSVTRKFDPLPELLVPAVVLALVELLDQRYRDLRLCDGLVRAQLFRSQH